MVEDVEDESNREVCQKEKAEMQVEQEEVKLPQVNEYIVGECREIVKNESNGPDKKSASYSSQEESSVSINSSKSVKSLRV